MDLMSTAQLLGNLGELLGAIAVVATLGYLAVQVKQNTKQLKAERRDRVQDHQQVLRMAIGSNPEVAELWNRGLRDDQTLDRVESARLDALLSQFIWQSFQIWDAFRYDDDGTWGLAGKQALIRVLSTPGGANWWKRHHVRFVPEFVAAINGVLDNPPSYTPISEGAE